MNVIQVMLVIVLGMSAFMPMHAQKVMMSYVIIDQYGGVKAKAPKWSESSQPTVVVRKDYPGRYTFVLERSGPDKNALDLLLNRGQIGALVARQIVRTVEDTIILGDTGTDATVQGSVEAVIKSLSKANIPGLQHEQTWWVEREFTKGSKKGQREFVYSVLYSMDKPTLDRIIQQEVEKTLQGQGADAKSRVKQIMDKALNTEQE